jgi:hypothetical protein
MVRSIVNFEGLLVMVWPQDQMELSLARGRTAYGGGFHCSSLRRVVESELYPFDERGYMMDCNHAMGPRWNQIRVHGYYYYYYYYCYWNIDSGVVMQWRWVLNSCLTSFEMCTTMEVLHYCSRNNLSQRLRQDDEMSVLTHYHQRYYWAI